MMSEIFAVELWMSLVTLTLLEVVLGVDNVIFLALIVEHLPKKEAVKARLIGILFAFVLRVGFLLSLAWMMGLTKDIVSILGFKFSGKDLMLLGGGSFLIIKSIMGIRECFGEEGGEVKSFFKSFWGTVVQAIFIDFVFSFDSIITAIGLTRNVLIIVVAMVIAMVFMFYASNMVSRVIKEFPSLKILALAFILMIGGMLALEAFRVGVNHGYIYFAMAFAVVIEFFNIKLLKKNRSGFSQGVN